MSQVLCAASKATLGSLIAENEPGGVAKVVVPGRKPFVQVVPLLLEVAQPISELPPLKMRPVWKAVTSVEPKENVSGSTSVLCWLLELVKGSLLSCMREAALAVRICTTSANTRANSRGKTMSRVRRVRRLMCMSILLRS